MAVETVFDARTSWVSEVDVNACRVIDQRWGLPNIGDLTTVRWDEVPPVDILTAGYPCQPFSHAGKRKGSKDVRHLWPSIMGAIRAIRPGLVALENVQGHLTLGGAEVVWALAAVGYRVTWGLVRASDAGAPHRRARLFILASDPDQQPAHGAGSQRSQGWGELADSGAGTKGLTLLPTPTSGDSVGIGYATDVSQLTKADQPHRLRDAVNAISLLPTPTARDYKDGASDPSCVPVNGLLGRAVWHMPLLPTPKASDGPYTAAIHRWEQVLQRSSPSPTEELNGKRRLSPDFVEWMMGLPEGFVTDVPHVTRTAQLKMLGNGVVPQQATLALRLLLEQQEKAA
jgi:DNA (cytosine-5)-methyltransferase 1